MTIYTIFCALLPAACVVFALLGIFWSCVEMIAQPPRPRIRRIR